ncbi:hypothetical protein [Chromobacterium piscinae]|uniref:hypothetical protein n=1 Tax=Chromobacterium piscinae TaxID=686831 RepID=UPI0031FD7709
MDNSIWIGSVALLLALLWLAALDEPNNKPLDNKLLKFGSKLSKDEKEELYPDRGFIANTRKPHLVPV